MSRTLSIIGVMVMLGAGVAQLPALAQKPDRMVAAVEHRQAMMSGQKVALRTLVTFSKGGKLSPDEAKSAAIQLRNISRQIPALFRPGTAVGVGDSKAKAEIWTQRPLFDQRVAAMRLAAESMVRATNTRNKDRVAAAIPAVSEACKGCHTPFQEKP